MLMNIMEIVITAVGKKDIYRAVNNIC